MKYDWKKLLTICIAGFSTLGAENFDFTEGYQFGLDFTYWKATNNSLNYAYNQVPVTEKGDSLSTSTKSLSYNWTPGFKTHFEKKNIGEDLDICINYVWNQNKQSSHISKPENGQLFSTLFNSVDENNKSRDFNHISILGKNRYQTFDLLFKKTFYEFKPFIGYTGMCLTQKVNSSGYMTKENVKSNDFRWKNTYLGNGIKIGTEYSYQLCDNVELFANVDTSFVVGVSKSTGTKRNDINEKTHLNVSLKNKDSSSFLSGYHLNSGISYKDCICNLEYDLSLGYEFFRWHNIGSIQKTFNIGSNSTMGYHGFLGSLKVMF